MLQAKATDNPRISFPLHHDHFPTGSTISIQEKNNLASEIRHSCFLIVGGLPGAKDLEDCKERECMKLEGRNGGNTEEKLEERKWYKYTQSFLCA